MKEISGIELRQLRYFVVVAEELHFTRAAARIGMAQPPLSQQIQKLERELGVQLFRRSRRKVELTAAGEVFLDGARRALGAAGRAVDDARRAGRGEIGRLAIGFVGSAVVEVLPEIVGQYHARYPDVELVLRQQSTAKQVDMLLRGELQAGLVRPPVHDPTIVTETVLRERLVVALPETHRLAERDVIDLADLARESFILFPRSHGPGSHDRIVRMCLDAGFSPRIGQEAVEMHVIAGLVAAGLGVSIVPASVRWLRREGVRYLPIAGETPTWELAVACRRGEASPLVRDFLAVAGEMSMSGTTKD